MVGAIRRGIFAVGYGLGRGCERAAQVFFHAAVGATRLEDLRRAIQRDWDASGQVGWDPYTYSGLQHWEDVFYSAHLSPPERVLVVGCGTGRELIALVERGFRADGVDLAPACAAIARRALASRGLVAEVYTAAIEDLTPAAPYDAIVFANLVYSLIPQASRRIGVLRRMAGHLTPGGRILVTYILRTGRPPRPVLIELASRVATLTGADWRPEYGDVVLPAGGGAAFAHFEHRFLPGEIEREVQRAGLRVLAHDPRDEGKLVAAP